MWLPRREIHPTVQQQLKADNRSALTVQLSGCSISLDRFGGPEGELRLSEAVKCLLWIGLRRTGLCIFPGAVLGRDCSARMASHTYTHTQVSFLTFGMKSFHAIVQDVVIHR